MAKDIAELEYGKGTKARPYVTARQKQIRDDVAALPLTYRAFAEFVFRNSRDGLPPEEIRAKLDSLKAEELDFEQEFGEIVVGLSKRRLPK